VPGIPKSVSLSVPALLVLAWLTGYGHVKSEGCMTAASSVLDGCIVVAVTVRIISDDTHLLIMVAL